MLMRCPECGEEISDQAEACPHCGAPVERTQRPSGGTGVIVKSRKVQGIIRFSAVIVVLLDILIYSAGRLVLMFKLREQFRALNAFGFRGSSWVSAFQGLKTELMGERVLVILTGSLLALVVGTLLSLSIWHRLHLEHSRRSTRWIIACSMSTGIVTTLISAWTFYASSLLHLPKGLFPEFVASSQVWSYLKNNVPAYQPEQWWLIPVLSCVFTVCCFVIVAARAVYVRLFER